MQSGISLDSLCFRYCSFSLFVFVIHGVGFMLILLHSVTPFNFFLYGNSYVSNERFVLHVMTLGEYFILGSGAGEGLIGLVFFFPQLLGSLGREPGLVLYFLKDILIGFFLLLISLWVAVFKLIKQSNAIRLWYTKKIHWGYQSLHWILRVIICDCVSRFRYLYLRLTQLSMS